jgi:hypothetical protein
MRQIRIGALLAATLLALAACSGSKFTTSDGDAASEDGNDISSPPAVAGTSNDRGGSPGQAAGSKSAGGGHYLGQGGAKSTGGSAGESSSSSGGAGGEANDEACAEGLVVFNMLPSPELPPDYFCDASCGTGWLTITDAQGAAAFSIFSACGIASCQSCEVLPCPAASCLPKPLTPQGSQLTWDGSYLAQDSCGSNMACQRRSCVPPGKYKAKACAAINAGNLDVASGSCEPKDAQLCAEVEFELPATREVKLVLETY